MTFLKYARTFKVKPFSIFLFRQYIHVAIIIVAKSTNAEAFVVSVLDVKFGCDYLCLECKLS